MIPTGYEICLTVGLLIVCGVNVLLLVMLRNWIGRYERFRQEAAAVLVDHYDNLADMNTRLTAAGYPPGRVVPASTYPGWAQRRI